MPTCSVKGVDIHYLARGKVEEGQLNLVFIHGAAGSSLRWEQQLAGIAPAAPGVALDLPGHGRSGGNPCDQVFLYREWVWEFVTALGLKNLLLVGHSMGGAIAMEYARKYPDEVVGLALFGTAPWFQVAEGFLEELRRGKYDEARARLGYSASTAAEFIDEMVAEGKSVDPAVRYTDYLACSRFAAEDLAGIKVPTLILCGEEDVSTPPEASRYLAQEIQDSRLVLIKDAAHNLIVEQPERVNRELIGFLREIKKGQLS